MKNKKPTVLRYVALSVAAYALLLCLLVLSERTRPDAQIDGLPEAIWYSLATLTTVGYGDLTPLSPVGRLIGGAIMLMSAGVLAMLIALVYAAVSGRIYPQIRLWLHRRDKWYIFTSENAASRALAARLDDGRIVFCGGSSRQAGGALCPDLTPEALAGLSFFNEGPRYIFAMDEDAAVNEGLAAALKDRPAQIYCRGDALDEALPANVTTFSDAECAARLYWQSKPWKVDGERVALIGNGRFARALLMQGMLTAPPGCSVELFGNWDEWRDIHGALSECPDMQIQLNFHLNEWHACTEVLIRVDRLVLCADSPEANRDTLSTIRRWCAFQGEIHTRCPQGLQNAWFFGDADALFTPELVMREALNARARRLHELYRISVDYPVPEWAALTEFMKRSNLAAADHLLTKLRLLLPEEDVRDVTPDVCRRAARRYECAGPEAIERCRRIEHARWCLFHALFNWRYAPARNNALRRHPLLVPYDRLDAAEQRKDDNAWLLIRQLADEETDA